MYLVFARRNIRDCRRPYPPRALIKYLGTSNHRSTPPFVAHVASSYPITGYARIYTHIHIHTYIRLFIYTYSRGGTRLIDWPKCVPLHDLLPLAPFLTSVTTITCIYMYLLACLSCTRLPAQRSTHLFLF